MCRQSAPVNCPADRRVGHDAQQEHVVGGMWLVLLSCWALTVQGQGQAESGSLENANWTNCSANSEIEMTFVSTAMTWNSAEQSCQRAQGHLASVITRNDVQCARRAFIQGSSICDTSSISCNESHVGLRIFGTSRRIFWLGNVHSRRNVTLRQASDQCGSWTINGLDNFRFRRGSCNVTERFFLCQRLKLFQVPQPDASQKCTGLSRSITYNTISFNRSDAAQKCILQRGMLARVLGENKACLTALMMSLGSGAQLEQTRVACGNCSSVADCVATLQNTTRVTMSYSTIQDARPFLCEIQCSAKAGSPVIGGQAPSCECHPGYTGNGTHCTPIATMPCVVTTTKMTSSPGVATTTMPGFGATTKMTSSPGVATTTMPGVSVTTDMTSSPGVTMTTPATEASSSKLSNIGLYAGAGAGAVVLLLLIGIVALLLKRTQERRGKSSAGDLHNVHRGSESSGVGLLRQPEGSRSMMSNPNYEQAPIPKATSLGSFANPTYTDVVNPTPKVPPPFNAVLRKEPTAGSGGSSQDAGASNNTPPTEGFYNTLQYGKDKEAGSGGLSQAAGATNTTPPPEGPYNTLQQCKDIEAGSGGSSQAAGAINTAPATSPGAFANPTFTDDVKPTPKLPPPIYAVVRKEPTSGSGGLSQDAGTINTTPPPEGFYNTLQHGKDKEAGSGGSSQAAGAINTTPPPGGFYSTREHDKDKEASRPSGSEVCIHASVGRQG